MASKPTTYTYVLTREEVSIVLDGLAATYARLWGKPMANDVKQLMLRYADAYPQISEEVKAMDMLAAEIEKAFGTRPNKKSMN